MSKISLEGNSLGSGTLTIAAPNTNSNFTLSLPTNTGTIITQNSTPAFASTIGVGGATAAASGAGITFPATQSASSDANTLDDYEEGTWTPSISGVAQTANSGSYVKIGSQVFIRAEFTVAGLGGGAADQITSLPFTPGKHVPGYMGGWSIIAAGAVNLMVYSNGVIYISVPNSVTSRNVANGDSIVFNATYTV